jgi:hypothetical protein
MIEQYYASKRLKTTEHSKEMIGSRQSSDVPFSVLVFGSLSINQ